MHTSLSFPSHPSLSSSGSTSTTETVQSAALALEGVDNVERGDGLALRVLGVGDGVANDGLEEGLEDAAGFFVDHWRTERLAALEHDGDRALKVSI